MVRKRDFHFFFVKTNAEIVHVFVEATGEKNGRFMTGGSHFTHGRDAAEMPQPFL